MKGIVLEWSKELFYSSRQKDYKETKYLKVNKNSL